MASHGVSVNVDVGHLRRCFASSVIRNAPMLLYVGRRREKLISAIRAIWVDTFDVVVEELGHVVLRGEKSSGVAAVWSRGLTEAHRRTYVQQTALAWLRERTYY